MNSKAPKPHGTQPQQFSTSSGGTPSPLAQSNTPPTHSQVMPSEAALENAAQALEPTAAALPNPIALEPTAPVLPNPVALEPTMPAIPNAQERISLGVAKTQVAPNDYRSEDPTAPLPAGFTLGGRYVIERHISSGSFGAVYKAADRSIPNHAVALKLLHIPAENDEAREKGLRELRLIASVAHPSVVQFKDYGWFEGRLWFAMPWYSGHTLYDRIGGDDLTIRTPLSRADARPIFERLAQGLAAMHAVGIHHHDIKPENVFLANVAGFEGGFPVLLDLGIAAARGELPAGFTAEYAAPETANTALGSPGHSIGAAADVFSLALTLRNVLDPDLIVDADVPSIAILTTRATQPTPGPARKDLRYLKPNFARWLSLDPASRPTPEEFAAELAVLTEPEDRREQRMRALRRAAPFLFAALLAVAFLGYQLSKQRAVVSEQQQVISVQEEKLNEETAEHNKLRAASQQQLAELEATKSQVGDKDAQLKRALGIAHDLDRQLSRVEQVRQSLSEKAARLDAELKQLRSDYNMTVQVRDRLQGERDGLVVERDGLVQQRNSLRTERDGLVNERNALRQERDGLIAQKQDLERTRDQLETERDNLRRSVDTFLRERDAVAQERDALRTTRDSLNGEITRLRAQIDSLEDERTRLRAENASLRERRASADTTPSTPATPSAEPTTNDDGVTLDSAQQLMERAARRRAKRQATQTTP